LTIAEGVAFITRCPAALETDRRLSRVGSQSGDRRVPAL
jgi:hypothetical protein